jgi:hypothetical protein
MRVRLKGTLRAFSPLEGGHYVRSASIQDLIQECLGAPVLRRAEEHHLWFHAERSRNRRTSLLAA